MLAGLANSHHLRSAKCWQARDSTFGLLYLFMPKMTGFQEMGRKVSQISPPWQHRRLLRAENRDTFPVFVFCFFSRGTQHCLQTVYFHLWMPCTSIRRCQNSLQLPCFLLEHHLIFRSLTLFSPRATFSSHKLLRLLKPSLCYARSSLTLLLILSFAPNFGNL